MTTKTETAKKKRTRNKADRLFQEVGLKDKPKCLACGKKAQVIHHFCPKNLSNALRYDLQNAIPLCKSCHFRHHTLSDPSVYEKMTANKPPEWFKYIREHRDKPINTTLQWYQEQIKKLDYEKTL